MPEQHRNGSPPFWRLPLIFAISLILHALMLGVFAYRPNTPAPRASAGAPLKVALKSAPHTPPANHRQALPTARKPEAPSPHSPAPPAPRQQAVQQPEAISVQAGKAPAPLALPSATSSKGSIIPAPSSENLPAAKAEQFTPASAGAAYLQNPPPDYPPEARRNGEEGSVLLRVEVNAQGHPETVSFKQRSGYRRLDEAARQAVLRWRFTPAQRNGEPLADTVEVTLTFRLSSGAPQ